MVGKGRCVFYTTTFYGVIILDGEGDNMKATNTSLLKDTNDLLLEIESLKRQLIFEKQQHKHWEELAMLFHDALWKELGGKNLAHMHK